MERTNRAVAFAATLDETSYSMSSSIAVREVIRPR
jgi:hypothetical protein